MSEEVKEKRRKATAIKYNAEDWSAPRLIAKGVGLVADRILEAARKHDIPIHFDPDMTNLLFKLQLDSDIPADLYQAVAEILAVVYRANNDKAQGIPFKF